MTRWTYADAQTQAEAIASGETTACALTEAAIARIEALDGRINAVIIRDFDRARQAAQAADAAIARGERRPLLGVPITVKESFAVAGLASSWGNPEFAAHRPAGDAAAITRLKSAGAVILGKTNIPFMLADWQSTNTLYGTTNNPWDQTRTAGGSSGGAGAALACGFGALELGSDIGGSIRVPAHFCGVFGHRPSYGIIPYAGHALPGSDAPIDLSVAGPLARSARDLALAFDLLVGPEPRDAVAWRIELPPPRRVAPAGLRLLVLADHPLCRASRAVTDPIRALADSLAARGATVSHASDLLPDLAHSQSVFANLLFPLVYARMPDAFFQRMAGAAAALDPADRSMAAQGVRATVLSHRDWLAADNERARIAQAWQRFFAAFDAVLCPPMPTAAFPHDHDEDVEARRITIDGVSTRYLDQLAWPGIAIPAGLPATVAPLGLTADGLPTGVQIIGPYLEDRTTLAIAAMVEAAGGGFRPPPDFADA